MRFFKELFKSPYLISLDILPKDFLLCSVSSIMKEKWRLYKLWDLNIIFVIK